MGRLRVVAVGLMAFAGIVFGQSACGQSNGTSDAYIEFLWQATVPDSGVRQVALGLLTHPARPHQFCWKDDNFPQRTVLVRLDAFDSEGTQVWSRTHAEKKFKNCRDFDLGTSRGKPGVWQFTVSFDGKRVAKQEIEVASELKSAHFYANPKLPYTIGHIDYTDSVAPKDWKGHFLWQMTVDESGRVVKAENVEVVGVARQFSEAGLKAAKLFLFPADPSRRRDPYVVRQKFELSHQ